MGDIAEMIMEGILCETCGTFMDDPGGYPRSCCDETHSNFEGEDTCAFEEIKAVKKLKRKNKKS